MLSVFFAIFIPLVCLFLLFEGRHILGNKPIRYELVFKTPITVEQLKALFEQVIMELKSNGYHFYLYDGGDNLVINAGSKDSDIIFGFDAWCYVFNKDGNIHFEKGVLYDSVFLEGNYFISSKKAKENMQFVYDVYNICLRSI